jgi:hypothetical protein
MHRIEHDKFLDKLIFSDNAAFHLADEVNLYVLEQKVQQ